VVVYFGVLALYVWLVNRAKRVPLGRGDFALAGLLAVALVLWVVLVAVVLV
jgi:hypothetical protein